MGWCRITLLPEVRDRLSRRQPALLAELDAMNAEADRLDPLMRQDRRGDSEEWEGEAKERGLE